MYAVISESQTELPVGMVVRVPGTWRDYQVLCASRGDAPVPRIKYRDGEILLMNPMPRHGREANILADVVKVLLDSQQRNYEAFTPITMDLPEAGGIEPDYCFYINQWQAVIGKDRLNWQVEPPPDLVLEVDVTSYTDVDDYLPYQVPEVWLLRKTSLVIYGLEQAWLEQVGLEQNGVEQYKYSVRSRSLYFPDMDVSVITRDVFRQAAQQGTGSAIQALRQRLSR